jgi:hypothetical protein
LIARIARENRSWGYDRIAGALANLGVTVSDQTVGNVLKRHGIAPAPERKITTTWQEFIRIHMDVLVATDYFTTEVWTLGGLVTYLSYGQPRHGASRSDSVSRTARRAPEILRVRSRMSYLTIRA